MGPHFHSLVLSLLFFGFSLNAKAQLCKGTLGAPIFKETFGAGTNPGPTLAPGTINYTYVPSKVEDGEYTISNISNPAPARTQWCTDTDHTGDPNGYMLVVNASHAPGEFFSRQVTGLCANTTYVFSGWIANANNNNVISYCAGNYVYPNVLFKVEDNSGTTIGSVVTGNIPISGTSLNWQQYGFTFATGPGQTSVYLIMVNNGPGGCGNDLVIDDISFSPCGPTTAVAAAPSKQLYCSSENILLDATIGSGYNNPVYQWQFSNDGGLSWANIAGATSADLMLNNVGASQSGKYRLLVAESGNINFSKCRIITDVLSINVSQSPAVAATPVPASICNGKVSTLTASGASSYKWSNGGSGSNINVNPSATSSYTVTGTNTITGCTGQATVTVVVNSTPASPVVSAPGSICSGNHTTLTATAPGGTYKWYDVSTGAGPVHTGASYVTPVLNTSKTYYVEVISATGCTSGTRTPVPVTVHTTPVSPVVTGSASICSGNNATLTATAPGGTYKWYDVSTGAGPVHTGASYVTPVLNASKTYYVEVISAAGCTSGAKTAVPVTVHTTPVSPVVTAPASICSGNHATLTATAPGGTYRWYDVSTGAGPVHTGASYVTPVLSASKTYYVEVISAAGCISGAKTPVTITVNTTPVSPVLAAPDTICENTAAALKALSPGGIYKWYNVSAGGTLLHTGPTYTPVLTDKTTYYVEVVSAAGCVSTSRTPVTVSIAHVTAQFMATPTMGLAPLKVDFINSSIGAKSCYWDFGDGTVATGINASHVFSKKGLGATFDVKLIATHAFGCTDTATITISIDPFSKLTVPNVFTPNNDGINDLFKIESIGLNYVKAELFNRWGLKIYEWDTVHGGWDGITLAGLEAPQGTYYYMITGKGVDGEEYGFKGHFTLLR